MFNLVDIARDVPIRIAPIDGVGRNNGAKGLLFSADDVREIIRIRPDCAKARRALYKEIAHNKRCSVNALTDSIKREGYEI